MPALCSAGPAHGAHAADRAPSGAAPGAYRGQSCLAAGRASHLGGVSCAAGCHEEQRTWPCSALVALFLPASRTHNHVWKHYQDLSCQIISALLFLSSYRRRQHLLAALLLLLMDTLVGCHILFQAALCFAGCEWPHAVADQAPAGPCASLNTAPPAQPTPAHTVTRSNPTSFSGRSWLSRNARIKTVGAPLSSKTSKHSRGCMHVEGTSLGARCIACAFLLSSSSGGKAVTAYFRMGALLKPVNEAVFSVSWPLLEFA